MYSILFSNLFFKSFFSGAYLPNSLKEFLIETTFMNTQGV
jgi:hypothetical protein